MSVRPYGTTLLLLEGFSFFSKMVSFMRKCGKILKSRAGHR
jgi:hypothetical protein